MKPAMKRSELQGPNDIWNAVIAAISHNDFPSGDETADEAFIVFQYYSEIESGGHEILLNWCAHYIEEKGINGYLEELTISLKKIGADDYAAIEHRYLKEIWRIFKELEQDEQIEEEFLQVIQKADEEYQALGNQLEKLMETYFIDIHTELINVKED